MRRPHSEENPELIHYPRVFTTCRHGFLFADRQRGFTGEDIVRLMLQDDVRRLLGPAFLAWRVLHGRSRWCTTTAADAEDLRQYSVMLTAEPAEHSVSSSPPGRGNFMYLRVDDAVAAMSLDMLVDRCWMLNKALGCTRCDLRGAECLWSNLPPELEVLQRYVPTGPQLLMRFDANPRLSTNLLKDAQSPYRQQLARVAAGLSTDDLRPWKSNVGGFLYIPEGVTSDDPLRPGNKGGRPASEHHFASLEEARAELCARNRAAAKTRTFIQRECHNCYFGNKYGPCSRWRPRHCDHGAWTEDKLVDYTLECARRRLLETKSHLTLNHIWLVANICGEPFRRRDERTGRDAEFVVQRIGEERDEPCIFVSRTARDARRELAPLAFFSLHDLKRFLPDLPRIKLENLPPLATPAQRRQLALWLQLSVTSHGKRYSFFFSTEKTCGYADAQPRVGVVKLHWSGVEVVLWLSKFERTHDFGSFQRVHDHYDELPYFSIADAEDKPQGIPLNRHIR
jgi:hypothetical protein